MVFYNILLTLYKTVIMSLAARRASSLSTFLLYALTSTQKHPSYCYLLRPAQRLAISGLDRATDASKRAKRLPGGFALLFASGLPASAQQQLAGNQHKLERGRVAGPRVYAPTGPGRCRARGLGLLALAVGPQRGAAHSGLIAASRHFPI